MLICIVFFKFVYDRNIGISSHWKKDGRLQEVALMLIERTVN